MTAEFAGRADRAPDARIRRTAANDGWASALVGLGVGLGAVRLSDAGRQGRQQPSSPRAGLTAGVDWRVHKISSSASRSATATTTRTIGSYGTRSNATSVSGTLYASYKAFDPWFIDAAFGYGQLGFDNRRFVADDGVTVAGNRQGGYWFGAVSTGYE